MPMPPLSADAYRQLVEQSPMLMWRSDLTRACDYFNDRWLAWTGRTMEEELGLGWADGVHADDYDRCVATYAAAFDRREPFEMEYRLRRHDGEYRWILDRGVPFLDDDGRFAGFIGSCIDVHEAAEGRRARAKLHELQLRRLTGLLPLCGQCKRVRDDVGYWQSVEQFVAANSDARFTYGYCPACYDAAMASLQAPADEHEAWVLPGI